MEVLNRLKGIAYGTCCFAEWSVADSVDNAIFDSLVRCDGSTSKNLSTDSSDVHVISIESTVRIR